MKFGSSALGKAIVVAAVALLVLIPVQMLRSLVVERAQMREQAVASVSRGWGGRQTDRRPDPCHPHGSCPPSTAARSCVTTTCCRSH